jgi:predicted membrane channel-forming protein YqfA (hemolysin III family)
MTQQPPSGPETPLQLGSSLIPLYVERRMKIYAVPEFEFDSLATRNTQGTTFYSVGSFLLSAALSVWVNAAFYTETTPTAFVMMVFVAPLVTLLAVVFFWLGWHNTKSRQSTWDRIKSEYVLLAKPESVLIHPH